MDSMDQRMNKHENAHRSILEQIMKLQQDFKVHEAPGLQGIRSPILSSMYMKPQQDVKLQQDFKYIRSSIRTLRCKLHPDFKVHEAPAGLQGT